MAHAPHAFWLNAGARNIAETTASAGHCRFLRSIPRVVDYLDLIVCAVIVLAMVAYAADWPI